jgi:PleD family two-component response regulator
MANLLVYDDNTLYWADLMKCLTERHEVAFVSTVEEALTKIAQTNYDMVVAAVYEDNENVFGLLQRIRTEGAAKNIPFVCVRGPNAAKNVREMDEAYRMATLMLGAKGYVAANDYSSLCPSLEQFFMKV